MEENLLTAAEEIELAKAIEVGLFATWLAQRTTNLASADELNLLAAQGEQAKRRFYLANLGLVGSLVEHWTNRTGLPADELFQEGCVGLGEAIAQFDWRRGTRFSTLAWKRINYAMMAAAATRCGELDARPSQAKAALEMRRDWQRREAELGTELSINSYAEHSGQSVARVMALAGLRRPTPLDEQLHSLPITSPQPTMDPGWSATLSDVERKLIALRYWTEQPLSLAAAAVELGMTTNRLRRLEQRTLAKIRAGLEMVA